MPTPARRPSAVGVLVAASVTLALVLASCSGGSSDGPAFQPSTPRLERGPAAPSAAAPPQTEAGMRYEWRQVPIGGGGFVTGLVIPDGDGRMYARTDVGGAYRWEPSSRTWRQLLDASSMSSFEPATTDLAVESIAVAPSNPDVVYLSVGNDSVAAPGDEPTPPTGRVLTSTDGGSTWNPSSRRFLVNGNMAHRQRSERLAVHPNDPATAWLGTRTEGLWRTTDSGATWSRVAPDAIGVGSDATDDLEPAGVSFVTVLAGDDPDRPRIWAGVAGDGIFESTDGGDSWVRIDEAKDGFDVPLEGSVGHGDLYVAWKRTGAPDEDDLAAKTGRIRRFDLEERSWEDITPEDVIAEEWSIVTDPTDARRLLVADVAVATGAVWRSTDGGDSWEEVPIRVSSPRIPWYDQKDVASWMSVGRLVADPAEPTRLWFAEGLGVWRVENPFTAEELEFVNESVGIEETVAAKVVAPPGGDPVSVLADVQGFWHRDLTTYPTAPLVDPTFAGGTDADWSGQHPSTLVWAGAEYQRYWDPARPGRGAISRDGGATWTPLPNLSRDQFGGNIAVSATDPDNIVWVPSYYLNPWEFDSEELRRGVFVTHDGGESWAELDGLDGSYRYHRLMWWFSRQALASDKVEGGVFYLNDDEGRFLITTDGGDTWEAPPHKPPCREANACHVHGQLRAAPDRAGEVWASVGEDGLYRTNDRGQSRWQKIDSVEEVRSFDFGAPLAGQDRPAIYLWGRVGGDPTLGLWRSGDQGEQWELIGRRPLGVVGDVNNVNGDLDEPGRVYLSLGGQGVIYGEDPDQ